MGRGDLDIKQEQWNDERGVPPVVGTAPHGAPSPERNDPVKLERESLYSLIKRAPTSSDAEIPRLLLQDKQLAHRERDLLAELRRVRVQRAQISISLLRQQGELRSELPEFSRT